MKAHAIILAKLIVELCTGICIHAFSGTTRRAGMSISTCFMATRQDDNKAIPYIITRGDGSQGGGGVPMPNAVKELQEQSGQGQDVDTLRRPKVYKYSQTLQHFFFSFLDLT